MSVARLSTFQTEDRNIYWSRKGLDYTTEGERNTSRTQFWLCRHPHTVVDPKKGKPPLIPWSSEKGPEQKHLEGEPTPGAYHCVLALWLVLHRQGRTRSWQERALGAFSPPAHMDSAFLLHSLAFFTVNLCPTCDKDLWIPYFILLPLNTQSLSMEIWGKYKSRQCCP